MGAVLTTNSSIKCASAPLPPGVPAPAGPLHGGNVDKTSNSKLKVNGDPVLLKSGIGPKVSGCQTPSSNSTTPCATATVITGEATKLKVGGNGGNGVMLADLLTGTTDGPPAGILSADARQTKLTAI